MAYRRWVIWLLGIVLAACVMWSYVRTERDGADTHLKTFNVWDTNLLWCVDRHLPDYDVHIIRPKGERAPLTMSLQRDGAEVYRWEGAHARSVFTRQGDVLFIALFEPASTGCSVLAYDIAARKELWKTKLRGLSVGFHSQYSNSVNIRLTTSEVIVYGREMAGRYVESLDINTGECTGHAVYPSE